MGAEVIAFTPPPSDEPPVRNSVLSIANKIQVLALRDPEIAVSALLAIQQILDALLASTPIT